MLEKTLERALDCKEIQPVHSRGDQSWDFFGRNDAKAETPVLWLHHAKGWLIGKDSDAGRDWGQEKGTTKDEMACWHHLLDGHEFGWTPGVGDGQEGLTCCYSWGCKESDMTERLNWTELKDGQIERVRTALNCCKYNWKILVSYSNLRMSSFQWSDTNNQSFVWKLLEVTRNQLTLYKQ